MTSRQASRDPWVVGGLVLLGLLTLGSVLLYRSAPQSVEEVRTQTWLAARPESAEPHLARARERLRTATTAASNGQDSLAIAAFTEAARAAWRARQLAAVPENDTDSTVLWAQAMLGWAALLQQEGTGSGLRMDDDDRLRQALSLVQSVRSVPLPPQLRHHAEEMQQEIQRQLRPGPLEWLPLRR